MRLNARGQEGVHLVCHYASCGIHISNSPKMGTVRQFCSSLELRRNVAKCMSWKERTLWDRSSCKAATEAYPVLWNPCVAYRHLHAGQRNLHKSTASPSTLYKWVGKDRKKAGPGFPSFWAKNLSKIWRYQEAESTDEWFSSTDCKMMFLPSVKCKPPKFDSADTYCGKY